METKSFEQKKDKFEVKFNNVNPEEPSTIEAFSAQNTLVRLQKNLADISDTKIKDLVISLSSDDILKAMKDIEDKNPGFTINMLYQEEYDFIGKYTEKAEIENSESEDPIDYFKNKIELVGWLLLYSESYQHSTKTLDNKIFLGDYEAVDRYKNFLKNLKDTDSSYGKVIQFCEKEDGKGGEETMRQLSKKIDSIIGNVKNLTVVREAGIYESIKRLIDSYHAEKVVLVDPNFSDDQYLSQTENEIKSIDDTFFRQNINDSIIYTFIYKDVKREVIIKPILLSTDTIKELPIAQVYEMGGASVEGTRNADYLSALFKHMQDKFIVIDLHRHAESPAYREFSKNNNVDLIAFSYPISEEGLYNGHSGTEPGYRIMLSSKS